MRKYLELIDGAFTSDHQEKAKYENRPYIGYSPESGLLYTQPQTPGQISFPKGFVDLGLSVLWASYDVGATSPSGEGTKYAWGEISWDTIPLEFDPVYMNSDMEWKEVLRPRTPSPAQVKELLDNTTATEEVLNGVSGVRYTASNGNSIFVSDVFRWTNAEKYAALNFWSKAEAACWKPSSGIIDNTNTYNEISGMKSEHTMKEYQYPFRGVCNNIPQDGATLLEYGKSIQLPANNTDALYCFPKTWTATQWLTQTSDLVQMFISATPDFEADANNSNLLGAPVFDFVNGKSALNWSSVEMQSFTQKAIGDYVYVRFLSKKSTTLIPIDWNPSECIDNSFYLRPNTPMDIESKNSNHLMRIKYDEFEGYPVTINWDGAGAVDFYLGYSCEFSTTSSDPLVIFDCYIKRKSSYEVLSEEVALWADYVDENGYLFLRGYSQRAGTITLLTEKPVQTDTASILSTDLIDCNCN